MASKGQPQNAGTTVLHVVEFYMHAGRLPATSNSVCLSLLCQGTSSPFVVNKYVTHFTVNYFCYCHSFEHIYQYLCVTDLHYFFLSGNVRLVENG